MDTNTIIIYLACIIGIIIFGRIFILPIKTILKIVANSILGGLLIFIINLIGNAFNFHIGLNVITAITVGILGIPRCNFTYYIKDIFIKLKIKTSKKH